MIAIFPERQPAKNRYKHNIDTQIDYITVNSQELKLQQARAYIVGVITMKTTIEYNETPNQK